ncbi:MAG: glycosyltransferase family protein [Desulfobaccales bacterium]
MMKQTEGVWAVASNEIWAKNLAALRRRPENLDLLPPLPEAPPRLQRVKLLAGEHVSLQVVGEDGREVTLHSPRRALTEAQELAEAAPVGKSSYLVTLGLGLGYHLLGLLHSLGENQHLIIVEKEPEVLWAALSTVDLTELWRRPRTMMVVSPKAKDVLSHLQRGLKPTNGDSLSFWGHPPSLRSQKTYYQEIISSLRPGRGTATREMTKPGLKKEQLRVLVVNPDYFLLPEVFRAFRHLGHHIQLSLFDKRREAGEAVLQKIIQDIRDFSPDLVFTVNHLGFDREGVLSHALDRLRIPSVSWYVDSPAIILSLYEGCRSDLAFIFVWDPTYIPEVQALGFELVFPLPLATDPEVFSPERAALRGSRPQGVVFVGNSMIPPLQEKLARLPADSAFQELFRRLYEAFFRYPFHRLEALLRSEDLNDHPLIQKLGPQDLSNLEAALLWKGTLEYRLACVRKLLPFHPKIYGDPGWRQLLGRGVSLHPEVNYYDQLPQVYGGSAINFNATSLQMKVAVNQRVFDVPAAGGFLLTDFRPQLAELFNLDKEMACYRDPEEIPELVRFYLKNAKIRRRITAQGRRRVLAEHTYRHRVAAMLEIMRRML